MAPQQQQVQPQPQMMQNAQPSPSQQVCAQPLVKYMMQAILHDNYHNRFYCRFIHFLLANSTAASRANGENGIWPDDIEYDEPTG